MAIYHFTTKPISRGKGQSAIAAAAYRSGERLRDEQANEEKHYKARAERIGSRTSMRRRMRRNGRRIATACGTRPSARRRAKTRGWRVKSKSACRTN